MKEVTTYYTCDRCGSKGSIPALSSDTGQFERGRWELLLPESESKYGRGDIPLMKFDLCNNCRESLFKWFYDTRAGRNKK